ncbi:MAG: S1 family peptidase [Minisyncoccota bacterium]
MSHFPELYKDLKKSVVAVISRLSSQPDFPDIIGTGFIVREDGLIMTNNHVIEAIKRLPRLKSKPEDCPIKILYFHWIPDKGMATVDLEVDGVGVLKREASLPPGFINYGPDIPDIGVIQVRAKGLPALKIAKELELSEGDEVMVSGFPMGTDTLRAPGWIHQLTPTLQSGIISAILPFPNPNAHAMLLNIMTQGGSSGSPIFNPKNGEVVGIEYGGIIEPKVVKGKNGALIYENNTTLTSAIPAKIVYEIYQKLDETEELKSPNVDSFKTIEELTASKKLVVRDSEEGRKQIVPIYKEDLL